MKQIHLDSYNSPNSLLVITSFPNPVGKKYGKRNFNAVGWHSERTISSLANNKRVVVCAEKAGDKIAFKIGKNLFIHRVWEKGNPLSIMSLFIFILRMSKIFSIFVQFEFNVFGGTLMNLLLLGLLCILRLMGKRITFELHQVILDIKPLENHVNITNRLIQQFLIFSLKIFYRALGSIVNNVIVFENALKKSLLPYITAKKIHVLSLPVEQKNTLPIKTAKRRLGISTKEFAVLLFGYINEYKGIDFAINAFKKSRIKNIRLLIAGGKNPYLKKRKYYQAFYSNIVDEAQSKKTISYFDFVPDKKVSMFYSAADLVILPYRVFMSASGPFSLALSHRKPVVISSALKRYAESIDFQEAADESRLQNKELVFPLDQKRFLELINRIKNKRSLYKKLEMFSTRLGKKRDIEGILLKYEELLFGTSLSLSPLFKQAFSSYRLSVK